MKISNNNVVSVNYSLEVDGTVIDESGDNPLTYLHGHGQMIPGFESQLTGLAKGDTYKFSVKPEEGYGEYNKEAVVDLDKSIFLIDGVMSTEVFEGAQLQMTDQDGNPMMGSVVSIGEETVNMDFNHILAGKTLNFSGSIQEIREASAEEIEHGHVHGPEGHQH